MFWRSSLTTIALIALASCDSVPHAWTRADIEAIAIDEADEISAQRDAVLIRRLEDLEENNRLLNQQLATVRNLSLATSEAHESLVGTFNKNVDQRNSEKIADMTRRGACGTRMVEIAGGWRNQPIPCTEADLLPAR